MLNGTLKWVQRLLADGVSIDIQRGIPNLWIRIALTDPDGGHAATVLTDKGMIDKILSSDRDELAPHIEACYKNLLQYNRDLAKRQRRDG